MAGNSGGRDDEVRNTISGSAGDAVQARDVAGGVHFHGPPSSTWSTPHQLPPGTRNFVNRVDDLERLHVTVADRIPICVLVGTAGVGKTSLAVHWAHLVADHFPDGQLHINLQGYDPGPPVTSGEALDHFLRSMGVPSNAIPPILNSKAALYRSVLAGRRVLVVLDNAGTAGQVRPLIPGAAGCLVLVTSRNRLSGLIARDGALRLSLDLLSASHAVELLDTVIRGYRRADDRTELRELARLCARLPLALRIAAERAISRPHMPLRDLIDELREESSLWDALTTEENEESEAVRAVFAWSYRAMSKDAGRLFRLLGLHPGPEFGTAAAAALVGFPVTQAGVLLDELVGAHLLEQAQPDRFRFHDLLRAYAADEAGRSESAAVIREAIRRALVWYVQGALAAVRAMIPGSTAKLDFVRPDEAVAQAFADYEAANLWYLRERANLVAATRLAHRMEMHDIAWKLPAILRDVYADRNQFDDWSTTGEVGLASARELGDRTGESKLLASLGTACNQRGERTAGIGFHTAALRLFRELGDRLGELRSINEIGLARLRGHELVEAMAEFHDAHELAVGMANPYWIAVTRGNVAHAHLGLEQTDEAVELFEEALRMCRESGDLFGEGDATGALAEAHRLLGRADLARPLIERSLEIARDHDNRVLEAYWLVGHGRVLADLGALPEALESYQRAAALQRRIGDRVREAEALDGTGEVYRSLGRPEDAINFHRMAVSILQTLDEPWLLAVALDNLASASADVGAREEAERQWSRALELLVAFPDPRSIRLRSRIGARLGG